jgi:hypothetical protein
MLCAKIVIADPLDSLKLIEDRHAEGNRLPGMIVAYEYFPVPGDQVCDSGMVPEWKRDRGKGR